MKAAFIHDHHFVYNPKDGKYYDGSGGVFEKKLWKRYLAVFDSLIVVGRQKNSLPNKLVDSTFDNVSFELRPELRSGIDRITRRSLIKKNIRETLSKVDFAIIRLPSVIGYLAQEICEEESIPYTLEVVTCPWDAYINYGNFKGKLVAPFEFSKLKKACKKAKNVIYVTRDFLQSRYPTKNNQINISNVLLNHQIDIQEAFTFYNEPIDIFKIGLIGSFHVKWKGHREAIKAVRILVDKGIKNIKLCLVGTGDYQWVLDLIEEENVQEYVEVIGTLDAGEKGIYPFIDSLHLYIHPSKQEGLPRVVIEALSRGRLVLGSSAAGIPELLEEKFLHKPGDFKKLANDISEIISNSEEWKKVIQNNWDRSSHYLEENLQGKRVDFLNKISTVEKNQTKPRIVLSISATFCLGFLRGQAKFLKENGFDVFLFSPSGDGLKEYGIAEGCTIVEIPYRREISPFYDLKCLFLTIKHLNNIKPDIINVGTPKSGLLGVLAAKILGIKNRVFTLRGLRSTAEPEGVTKKVVEYMEKLTHKTASHVISITPSMARYAIENKILDKSKTVILGTASSNGININRFSTDKDPQIIDALRREFNIKDEDFIVGFVGRVVKSKGVEEIYKAYKDLANKYPFLKLFIVGPIEDTSDAVSDDVLVEMKNDNRIIFTGQRKDVDYLYHIMNVFTLPSHNFREGFGNVAMEASASGIPIIVTRGAGCQDAVIDGDTGTLIDPINYTQLRDSMENYICDRDLMRKHGLNGRKYAVDFFRNEIIWQAQLDFYNKLLNRNQ